MYKIFGPKSKTPVIAFVRHFAINGINEPRHFRHISTDHSSAIKLYAKMEYEMNRMCVRIVHVIFDQNLSSDAENW